MIDKLSRRILAYMNASSKQPSEDYYDFGEDVDAMAAELNSNSETIRSAIRFLEELNYIKFGSSQSGTATGFYLDHKGLHWKEFRRAEILKYLEEKWIDFLAMLFALAAIIISLVT